MLVSELRGELDATARHRALAGNALVWRLGSGATEFLVEALRDRAAEVNDLAALCLASVGTSEAGPALQAWLRRKLRRKTRLRTFDYIELCAPLIHGCRWGQLPEVAEVLLDPRARYSSDEVDRLEKVGITVDDGLVGRMAHLSTGDVDTLHTGLREWLSETVSHFDFDDQSRAELARELADERPRF